MTLNWGHKLTIAFILFGTLMFVLVYKSIQTDYELVSKDYYKEELNYQQVIDGSANAGKLSTQLKISKTKSEIVFQFPAEFKNKQVTGTLYFYCSYATSKDKLFKINLTEDCLQTIETAAILPGTYTVKSTWQTDGKNYYNEQLFTKE